MKKHLIAAAVAAAVAVPAMAQVTVSGLIDTGIGSVNDGATSFTGSVNNISGTSNFRFSGSEDLGGGLRASFAIVKEFTVSSGVESDNTTVSSIFAAGNTDTQLDRFANLFVSVSGGFGTVTLGKQQALARNAGGVAALIGNQGLSGTFGTVSSRVIGDKVNDAFSYTTPTVNGFTAQVLRGSRQASTATAAVATGAAAGAEARFQTVAFGATYVAGPLRIGAGTLKRESTVTDEQSTRVFGVSYDLGFAALGLTVGEFDPSEATANDEHKTSVLNVSVPMGKGLTLIGAFHTAKDGTGANTSSDAMVVGANYAFSKRTTGYATYAKVSNDDNASYSISGITAVATNGRDPKTIAFGLRHSF